MSRKASVALGFLCVTMLLGLRQLSSQGQPEGPGGPEPGMMPGGHGPMGPGMRGPMGPPPPPPAVITVEKGVVYLAREGKLIALEARSLKKLAEVTFFNQKNLPGHPTEGPDAANPDPPAKAPMEAKAGSRRPANPPPPPVTLTISEGVVYLACGPTLSAYEAKTLKKLGEFDLSKS